MSGCFKLAACVTFRHVTDNLSNKDLSILVLHYRTPDILRTCLDKLAAAAPGVRVVVVNSGPPEDVAGLGAETLQVPNHSFAHTLNCGLKLVTTPYAAHMNADVYVTEETFPKLLEVLKQPGVGMAGPRARTPDGRFQNQGLPYKRHYARLERQKISIPVPWLSGCLQLVKMDAVAAVGGMDASLRFYNEDTEWCYRFRQGGFACHLVDTDVLHLGGSSTPADPRFIVEGFRGGYKLSQRYHGHVYQTLHRTVVRVMGAWGSSFAKTPAQRQASAQVREMFRQGSFDESPFGETLDRR